MKRARVDTPPPRPKLLEDGAGITFEYINEAEAELIYNEIVVSGCYAKHGIELTPGAFVVDGGANLGLFSLWCALQAPTLRILAFEPLPPIATILRRNLRSNFEAQATLLDPVFEIREEALGRETASGVPFTYYPTSPGESTRHPDERLGTLRRVAEVAKEAYLQAVARAAKDEKAGKASDESDSESTNTWIDALKDISNQAELELRAATDSEAQTFPCEVTTLSCALASMRAKGWPEVVDLLKLDVEGEELSALEGIEPPDWPRIRQVVVEVCSPGEQPEKVEVEVERRVSNVAKGTSRLGAVKQLLESKGFYVVVENQDSGVSPHEDCSDKELDTFLHFTPKEAGLFYVYARRA